MNLHGSHRSRTGLMIVAIVTLSLNMVSPSSAAPIRQYTNAESTCEVSHLTHGHETKDTCESVTLDGHA